MLKPINYLLFTQLALSCALFAMEEDELYDEMLTDENDTDLVADLSQYPTVAQRYETITPPVKHHYVLMGEMLYVKPSLDSMPWMYVYDDSENNDATSAATTYIKQSDKLKLINMPYDFGFRIAAGFNATWMNFELLTSWTRFHTHKKASVSPLPYVNFADPGVNQPVTYHSYWNGDSTQPSGQIYYGNNNTELHWDQIDLTAKIPLTPIKRLTLSPVIGVRGLISNFQNTTTFFTTEYGSTDTTTPPFNENITKVKQRFRAIGLVGGLDGDVELGCGFHLSALAEGSLVYGNLKSKNLQDMIVPVQPTIQVPTTIKNSSTSDGFKSLIDAQVALSWNRAFWKNKVTFNMHIGYEAHFAPNFFELLYSSIDSSFVLSTTFFDLTLQGLEAGLGISF